MFIDRYDAWQSDEEFLKIEGFKVVSEDPNTPILGSGTGTVAVVGEALLNNYDDPTEITSEQQFTDEFGRFADWNNPGGPINSSSGISEANVNPTSYDGNLFLAIRGRTFKRLVCVGVRQDVGEKVNITVTADAGTTVGDVELPPGVRVATTSATPSDIFATCERVAIAADDFTAGVATVAVHVRRVKGTTASAVSLTQVLTPDATAAIPGYTLSCTDTITTVSDRNLVTMYSNAITSLLSDADPCPDVDIVYIARHLPTTQGETLMNALKTLAVDRSAKGRGLRVIVAPPIATTEDVARGDASGTVGVGNFAGTKRVDYAYPGVLMYVPELASASCSSEQFPDGLVYWPSDSALACCEAAVNPEQNPGQKTAALSWVRGIEKVAASSGGTAAPMTKADYIANRAAGIASPARENGTYVFQSGITADGPSYPIAQERIADYIEDNLALGAAPFQKKLATQSMRDDLFGVWTDFLENLKSSNQPALSRIRDFSLVEANTDTRLAKGIVVWELKVWTWNSADAIVLRSKIGNTVEIVRA